MVINILCDIIADVVDVNMTTCSAYTNKKTEKKCTLKYSAVINILCDIIADVADVNMKTRPLISDDRACVAS